MRIEQGARIIVENWIHAQPEDVIHFITDETKLREADAFVRATRRIGAIPKLTVLPSDSVQAGDSIEEMRHIMSYATAIVGATNYSFITTNAVDYALRHGARFLSLPLSTNNGASLLEQDFIKMDPRGAARMGRPMLRCLRSSDTVHITTKLGTDIHFSIAHRKPGLFNGVTARAGVCASASFEVYIPPVETETHGRVILDGSMGYIGLVKKPLELGFERGYLTYIEPTEDGRRLKAFLEDFGDPEMYCAAELGIGQAGGRYDLTPERVAINLDDARIQDNEGNQPIDVAIFEDGAPAYFSNLPIKAMVARIREVGLPASVSNTAGTFVCNHLMYGVLYHIAKSYPGVKGGFMHVPFVPSQTVNRPTPAPSMCERDIARGIEAAIAAIAENETDITAAEGRTH